MHLIPQSWSHFHILVSVFPSVGLVFVLTAYVVAMNTGNELMKRTCLVLFGILGVLAIPTYLSGDGTAATLANNPRFPQNMVDAHYGWSMAALTVLVLLGIASFFELWRYGKVGRLSNDMLNLVLGLAIATLGLMIVCGELGWDINHIELRAVLQRAAGAASASDIPDNTQTPQAWSHFHMILNHFPTVGLVISLALYITALVNDNEGMKRTGLVLLTLCAILGIPTYVTGAAAMWAISEIKEITTHAAGQDPLVNAHRDMALATLFGLAFTGIAAWIELWRYRYLGRFSNRSLYTVLTFAVITLAIMAETGHRGGQINHPEIRTEAVPTETAGYLSPYVENMINNVIWFVPWQTIHFFGYSIVFGVVTAVILRIFGFWKSMPFSAVHRILPLGVFGVTMNIFTGMLMLMADTFRYVNETSFIPKMFLLPIGASAVLYFSLNDALWATKANEDAPMQAKWFAALVLLAWTGVIMGGRLLPYV
jgi:uncharacterized membrane protein